MLRLASGELIELFESTVLMGYETLWSRKGGVYCISTFSTALVLKFEELIELFELAQLSSEVEDENKQSTSSNMF